MIEAVLEWLVDMGLAPSIAALVLRFATGFLVLAASWLSGVVARRILGKVISRLIVGSRTDWDNILMKHGVFDHVLRLVPALVAQLLISIPLQGLPDASTIVRTGIHIYMLVILVLVVGSVLNASLEIYRGYPVSKRFNIKSFIQVAKIIVYMVVGIVILSLLVNRSPLAFLSGMAAMSAVMLLIFKDAILGFVAGIQLTANNMVHRGDWIEMPKFGADGDVLDVTLTTVMVQNWDKTITTIPTYALISDAFKNWRGMEQSGGRRIKRSIWIDMTTVRVCDQAMIERFCRFAYISEYIDRKQGELAEWNAEHGVMGDELINGRRITNLGTFRAYVEAYLREHPMIKKDMTFLVRQLQPTEKGLPIEIYVFASDQRWVQYESIQSDIFDHIIAVIPEFDLRVFQQPTGQDVAGLGGQFESGGTVKVS